VEDGTVLLSSSLGVLMAMYFNNLSYGFIEMLLSYIFRRLFSVVIRLLLNKLIVTHAADVFKRADDYGG
jgi:hypothetical protein